MGSQLSLVCLHWLGAPSIRGRGNLVSEGQAGGGADHQGSYGFGGLLSVMGSGIWDRLLWSSEQVWNGHPGCGVPYPLAISVWVCGSDLMLIN